MLKIGLTGGVGSGKSTVAGFFEALSVAVLDADAIARELAEPGQPVFAAIAARFGEAVLQDGRINRAWLRGRVFAQPDDRAWLESLLHPLVYQTLTERSAILAVPYVVFAVPLLIETGPQGFVDRVLLVDCPTELQISRVSRRDGSDGATVRKMLLAQASREQRLARANDVIENNGAIDELRPQVAALHRHYLALAEKFP